MLFDSVQFIFLFLPIALVAFRLLGRSAAWVLIICSVVFYTAWQPINLLLIAPSILVNYFACRLLLRWNETRRTAASAVFWAGIGFNIAVLCYFKYTGFLSGVLEDLTDAQLGWRAIAFPLGISFITFQKVALLVDVRQGRVRQVAFGSYLLFVLFFPPLICGPIVHYRELMPQFERLRSRPLWDDLAVGATLFVAGLFKKTILADPLGALIAPVWADTSAGMHPQLFEAWGALLGYTLQLYFDFSGYSDMALGVARMFGIKLPYNFNSPLKARSVLELWARWHVTATRFLTAYVNNPIALWQTRQLTARGVPICRERRVRLLPFLRQTAFPTATTMLLSGLWHGAGYQFIVWGALHALALVVNHAWRNYRPSWLGFGIRGAGAVAAWSLTFLFVIAAGAFFRAPSVAAGLRMWAGMTGLDGIALPMALQVHAAPMLAWLGIEVQGVWSGGQAFLELWLRIAAGLVIVLKLPNMLELLAAYEPALGFRPADKPARLVRLAAWAPQTQWAVGMSVAATAGFLSLGRVSPFLYWQF